jgi:hypothetical protein
VTATATTSLADMRWSSVLAPITTAATNLVAPAAADGSASGSVSVLGLEAGSGAGVHGTVHQGRQAGHATAEAEAMLALQPAGMLRLL